VWAPFGVEGDNMWIQIGNQNPTTELCRDHGKYGSPPWGVTTDVQPWKSVIYCCSTAPNEAVQAAKPTLDGQLYTSVQDGSKDQFGQLVNTLYLDDVLTSVKNIPLVRKVRVQLTSYQTGNYLQLAEVEVFDDKGINRAVFKPATQSSTYSDTTVGYYPASLAVNNDTGTFSHTLSEAGKY
jgi:hypothetical protein